MFKFIVVAAALVACVAAGGDYDKVEVLEQRSDVRADGFISYLRTDNGIIQEARGFENGNIDGSFEYITPEGVTVSVIYNAGPNGYVVSSNALPTPPPIPEAILRSIEYNKAHALPQGKVL